jgi:hypothetical protein
MTKDIQGNPEPVLRSFPTDIREVKNALRIKVRNVTVLVNKLLAVDIE